MLRPRGHPMRKYYNTTVRMRSTRCPSKVLRSRAETINRRERALSRCSLRSRDDERKAIHLRNFPRESGIATNDPSQPCVPPKVASLPRVSEPHFLADQPLRLLGTLRPPTLNGGLATYNQHLGTYPLLLTTLQRRAINLGSLEKRVCHEEIEPVQGSTPIAIYFSIFR